MPLNQRVIFKAVLQKQNRLQIPKLVRLKYKLESSEIIKITISINDCGFRSETFFARMQGSGRIRVPNLSINLLTGNKPSLEGKAINVTIEPE